jgi:hypothetical protein
MGLIDQVRRSFSRLIHRRGLADALETAGTVGLAGLGMGAVTVAIGHWLSPWMTPQQLLLGYGSFLGTGLAGYGLVQWGDRLHVRLNREEMALERSLFGRVYFQTNEQLENVIGTFAHPQDERYRVTLNTEKEVYFLGDRLQPEEAAWLTGQIQQWLRS